MKVDTIHPFGVPLSAVPDLTRTAEKVGFDGLRFPEGKQNSVTALTAAAFAADRIELGSALNLALTRSPMITAQTAWELAGLTRGRFTLGIGSQFPAQLKGRFSVPSDHPGPRLREYILSLRAIFRAFAGGALDFSGEFWAFDLLPDMFRPDPIDQAEIPILVGASGPWMTRMAGEVADGLIAAELQSRRYLQEVVRPLIAEGAVKAGRDARDVELVLPVMAFVGDESELEEMRSQARQRVAIFVSTGGFDALFALHGWTETAEHLKSRGQYGADDLAGVVTDEMLDELTVITTWDRASADIHARYSGIADRLIFPQHGPHDPETLERWGTVATQLRERTWA